MGMQNQDLANRAAEKANGNGHIKSHKDASSTGMKNSAASHALREFYSALSKIQAELEDLETILSSIRRGKTVIPTYAEYIKTTKEQLDELMKSIDTIEISAEVVNYLHTIRHLKNSWEQIKISPLIAKPETELKVQEQLHYLDMLDEQIHKFNYQISLLAVPQQINERLHNTSPGYFIPFHELFSSDVPNREDRDQLLKYIALTPRLTPGGFVDIESGRIYKYSTSLSRRLFSLVMMLAGLALATGIVAASCFIRVDGWPLQVGDLPKMIVAWAAVLVGMGVHVVVGSTKRSKTQNGMPSVLLDLILIIDARFGEIMMKLLLGLIGLFALVIISTAKNPPPGVPPQIAALLQVTPLNAFLVGYSLDSIIELFGTSLESTSQVKSLIK